MKVQHINSLLNKFESNITEVDNPNNKYINVDLYQNTDFNPETIVKLIQNEIKDKDLLIYNLKQIVDNLKSDIYNQVNSNYDNYLILSSKLKNIDFLIENIQKPLFSIKTKLTEDFNYLNTFCTQMKEIRSELVKINSEVLEIDISIKIHELYNEIKTNFELIKKHIEKVEPEVLAKLGLVFAPRRKPFYQEEKSGYQ